MKLTGAPVAVVLCMISACATAPASRGPQLPSDLQRVLDDYSAAWEARDSTSLAALFAEGRMVVPNACPPVNSRAGLEACYSGSGGPIDLRALDHGVGTEQAYIIGEYAEQPGDPASGKFVLTLVKVSGRWLIVADMDQPYRQSPTPQ